MYGKRRKEQRHAGVSPKMPEVDRLKMGVKMEVDPSKEAPSKGRKGSQGDR